MKIIFIIIIFLFISQSLCFSAVKLNGDADYVRISTSDFGFASFTVSCWVKKGSNNTVDAIVWHGNDGSTSSFRILSVDPGTLQLSAGKWDNSYAVTSFSITDTVRWHFVAVTFDGSTLTGYFDGSSATDAVGLYGASNTYTDIGQGNAGTYWADAEINEVAIWNTALSIIELDLLYNSRIKGMPLQVRPNSLKGYWPLDDLSHNTGINNAKFNDLSNNKSIGTGVDADGDSFATAEQVLSYP